MSLLLIWRTYVFPAVTLNKVVFLLIVLSSQGITILPDCNDPSSIFGISFNLVVHIFAGFAAVGMKVVGVVFCHPSAKAARHGPFPSEFC